MSIRRGSGWLRFGAPAAVSVVLGVVAGIWVSRASAARAGLSVLLGAVAAVAAWALWEAWRAVRDAHRDDSAGESVIQTAHVRDPILPPERADGGLIDRPMDSAQFFDVRVGAVHVENHVVGLRQAALPGEHDVTPERIESVT